MDCVRGSHVSETEECGLDLRGLTTCELVKTMRDRWNLKGALRVEIAVKTTKQNKRNMSKSRVTVPCHLVLCGGEVWAILNEHSTQD